MSNPDGLRSTESIGFGQFTLVPAERLLKREGSPLFVGSRAFDILTALVEQAGTVVSKKELIARAWPDMTVDESGVRYHVAALRKALKDGQNGNRYIANVAGRGYCFVAPITRGGRGQPAGSTANVINAPAPCKLPPRPTRMVGRDETVQDLLARLIEHRFITVTGAGGMGKSTVAIAVAHELAPAFDNSVWTVDLSEINDPDLVPSMIATAFGIMTPTLELLPGLSAFVSDKRLLLVLDNCEHVVGAVASIAEELFKHAPGLHILATGREALRASGEQVYRLQPLSSPPPGPQLSAKDALSYPAVQLFVWRAASSGTQISLSDAEARIVSSICSRLGGVPLAIDIAACRVAAYGLTGTADLLSRRLCWLYWQGHRTNQSRHRTLHTLVDWSYNLLADDERLILRRLSVFARKFTLEEACAVAADTELNDEMVAEVICSLVVKSLLSTAVDASGSISYRLLETTRAYAFEKLTQNSEAAAVVRKLADYGSDVPGERDECAIVSAPSHAARQRSQSATLRADLASSRSTEQIKRVRDRGSPPLSLFAC
jgi:predicted ATPase/DNA-binding winged helix-turn-helix (wHTH) protein